MALGEHSGVPIIVWRAWLTERTCHDLIKSRAKRGVYRRMDVFNNVVIMEEW